MTGLSADEISKVTSFERLVELLRNELDWPIPEDYGFEDVVYDYEAADLDLKPDEIAKIREIHQLRPLVTAQAWGIFFISFEDKAISVTVLRRILRRLVVKKRAVAAADQQTWNLHDLIFVANFGKSGEREIAFAHFSDGAETGDLPLLKILGWNAKDTRLHNEYAATMLSTKLCWPDDTDNKDSWRENWRGAFQINHGEVIRTSKDLAIRLADLATNIRHRANDLLAAESVNGPMRKMHEAFRKNLIEGLDEDGFADMFAQTIAYGLLAARISRQSGGLVADTLTDMVPKTNPFLRELFETFLSLGGRDKRKEMDFDELGVRDVVDMLTIANMEAVLRDFGDQNPKDDPVIHFYELFLKEYDPQKRAERGVFYTPRPVVNFIVRGVDEVLRTEFGLPLGLADTMTWKELAAKNDEITIPDHVEPNSPFVQILDMATGTGTFLVEVIDLIHKRMVTTWEAEGKSTEEIMGAWNIYVPAYLLPRLTGFELMMAPYAIAHMKLGLKLYETGYRFDSNERARIFLTNTLEPARDLDMEFIFMSEALAHEAQAANDVKANSAFTAVIGNPPYKGESLNPSKRKGKLTFAGELVEPYFCVDGAPLGERNPKWINNDYVKFVAFAERQISNTGFGVIGCITSNSWLESPTFRGVRAHLLSSFPWLRIVDLHGNIKKRETAIDGSRDEGVFAIEEGVNIALGAKQGGVAEVYQIDLLGTARADQPDLKFDWLIDQEISAVTNSLNPESPDYLLVPMTNPFKAEYFGGTSIKTIMPLSSAGIVTANDALCIQFTRLEMEQIISGFLALDIESSERKRQAKPNLLIPKPNPDDWKLELEFNPLRVTQKEKREARDWRRDLCALGYRGNSE